MEEKRVETQDKDPGEEAAPGETKEWVVSELMVWMLLVTVLIQVPENSLRLVFSRHLIVRCTPLDSGQRMLPPLNCSFPM